MMNQIEVTRISYDAPCMPDVSGMQEDGFDVIMELSKEEKQELINMWRSKNGKKP